MKHVLSVWAMVACLALAGPVRAEQGGDGGLTAQDYVSRSSSSTRVTRTPSTLEMPKGWQTRLHPTGCS